MKRYAKVKPNMDKLIGKVCKVYGDGGQYIHNDCLMPVILRLSDAVTADMQHNHFDMDEAYSWIWSINTCRCNMRDSFRVVYGAVAKGSAGEKLAEAAIELLKYSLSVHKRIVLQNVDDHLAVRPEKPFMYNVFHICSYVCALPDQYTPNGDEVSYILRNIEELCRIIHIDLWTMIRAKLIYDQYKFRD